MTEFERDDTQWWLVEPPEHDIDLLEDEPDETFEQLLERGYRDARERHALFENVQIKETDTELSFEVPKRLFAAPNAGKFIVEAWGRQKRLKERDDFGRVRFTAESGHAIWIPHLFPFEEVDANGLPLIQDRERCEVTISLDGLPSDLPDNFMSDVEIQTPFGLFHADEAPESYNPDWTRYFTEFTAIDKPLLADSVTFPERQWESLGAYMIEKYPDDFEERLHQIYDASMPIPDEYRTQIEPNDWWEREPSGFRGTALGSIWVPVELLREPNDAQLSFPCFRH